MDYIVLPNNLREIGKKKRISQETLANAIGVSKSTIVNIESGKQEPSIIKAYYIAAYIMDPLLKIFAFSEEVDIKQLVNQARALRTKSNSD